MTRPGTVRPGMTRVVGVIPAADRGGHIGGAPPPLLQTGEGTFLERAIGLLRGAGVEHIVVGVRSARDPVAAQALRAGAGVVEVQEVEVQEDGSGEPLAALLAAEAHVSSRSGADGTRVDAGGPDHDAHVLEGLAFLLLPPTFPGVRASTVEAMVLAWEHAADDHDAAAPLLPEGDPSAHLPWHELAPLVIRGPGAARRLQAMVGGPGMDADRDPAAPRHGPRLLRIPVTDSAVGQRIDTLPLYRRHFPQAFRKRFQKW